MKQTSRHVTSLGHQGGEEKKISRGTLTPPAGYKAFCQVFNQNIVEKKSHNSFYIAWS